MTAEWEHAHAAFRKQDLSDRDYVYLFADGVHFRVRLKDNRLCARVLIGVRADASKELVAVEGGYRESEESRASVLRDLKRRGDARARARGRRWCARVLEWLEACLRDSVDSGQSIRVRSAEGGSRRVCGPARCHATVPRP
jgi:hypothetical protein